MDTSSAAGNEAADRLDVPLMPYRRPLRTWAGHGTGATCHRCGLTIEAHDIEYEVELAPPGNHTGLRFHFKCYRTWETQT